MSTCEAVCNTDNPCPTQAIADVQNYPDSRQIAKIGRAHV